MEIIPPEIFQKISFYLDNKSLCNVLQTNKKIKTIHDDYFWKKKCIIEYKFHSKRKIFDWKDKYIKLWKNLCIGCLKKTNIYNRFFKENICRSCEKSIPKYQCISHRRATKEYFLTNKDLSKIRFIRRNNPFNSNHPLKLYLKSDILDYIKNVYGFYNYRDLREQKLNSRSIKSISFLTKFNILNTILIIRYRINIQLILMDINRYSKNLYIKYLRRITSNEEDIDEVIKKCIELDFIYKYTNVQWEDFTSFENILLYHLLTSTHFHSTDDYNEYIVDKINNLVVKHKDKIKRKIEFLKEVDISSLKIPVVLDYIYKNCYTLKDIKMLIELENFTLENTNVEEAIMYNIINCIQFDKKSLYIKYLRQAYFKNNIPHHIIPHNLYKFILI